MRIFSERGSKSKFQIILETVLALLCLAILGAILYPVFAQDRGSHRSACMSHMRQLALSTIMYGADNSDVLPPYYTFESPEKTRSFFATIAPYSKNNEINFCPQDDDQANAKKPYDPSMEGVPGVNSYVHCLSLMAVIPKYGNGNRLLDMNKVEEPAQTHYFRDPVRGTQVIGGKPSFVSPHQKSGLGMFTFSFLDGHVKAIRVTNANNEL